MTQPTQNTVALVHNLLKDKSIESITIENKYFLLSVTRNTHKDSTTFAIGFGADMDEEDDDEEYDDFEINFDVLFEKNGKVHTESEVEKVIDEIMDLLFK